ncbi:Sulfotransferase domain family protein [Acanthocheilonema viteae]
MIVQKRFPQAIIIGVKKAGTRALLEFLRLNPAIKAPGPEVHFFDKNFDKGFDWYRSRMPETSITEITVEKTPAYFVSKTAPGRIRSLNSTIKLIIVVRNPITRAISDYTQAISKKRRNTLMPSFEEMVLGNNSSNTTGMKNGVNASWGAIRIGIYHRHIRRWLQHFPLHQIHFVDGERLITNPAAEIYAVERFLTVKPVVRQSNFATDPLKGFPCVLRKDDTLHCLGKTKGRAHPHVRLDVIQKLEDFYRPQNEEFFKLINRRFHWHSY